MNIQYRSSDTYNINDSGLIVQLPTLTKTIGDSYPGHFKWLDDTFIKGLQQGKERGYSFAVDYDNFIDFPYGSLFDSIGVYKLSGCALLKNTPEEKKLCCLFIDPAYRKQGIASKLVENSFEILGTTKPFLTIAENNLSQLQGIIKKYGFELTSVKESVYKKGIREYYYNEGLAR